jgi:hypothetical protein
MEYLLREAESCISDIVGGITGWNAVNPEGADEAEMTSQLKVMVMLGDPPPDFVTQPSRADRKIATRGRQFRLQLPSYLEQQRALLVTHSTLPAVLRPLVAAYAATNPEDIWTDGLRIVAGRPKRTQLEMGAHKTANTPLRRSLRLRQRRT